MKHIAIKTNGKKTLSLSKEWDSKTLASKTAAAAGMGQLPVDILENQEGILLVTPIAGADLERTEIVIHNDVLTIKGERFVDTEAFGFKDKDIINQECFWGEFSRSVILPADVDTDRIEATHVDHVLFVRIPKRNHIKMRIVKIK